MLHSNMSRFLVEAAGQKGATKSNPARILDEFFIYTNPEERSIGRHLSNDGFWEAWVTSWITKNILEGDICIDIGSNYGYFTRILEVLCGSKGKVHAVEANPKLAELLMKSIKDYPIYDGAEVLMHNVAASNNKGKVTLSIPTNFIGGSSIVYGDMELPSDIPDSEWDDSVEVDCELIDSIIKEDRVKLIKIDIEGAEPLAWEGMSEILQKTEIVIIEISIKSPKDFVDKLFNNWKVAVINNYGNEMAITRDEINKLEDLVMLVLRKNG